MANRIPFEMEGNFQLDLEYMGSMRIIGKRIRLELLGEPNYGEQFAGHRK